MGIILSGLWQDPRSTLTGMLRRVIRRAEGTPRADDTAQRLTERANSVRYLPIEMADLLREYPGYPQALFARAEVEQEDGRWEAVLETAQVLVDRFGSYVHSFRLACLALRQLRRFGEAEAMAIRVIRLFPDSPAGWEAYAQVAQDQADMATAEQRWRATSRRFPKIMWPRLMVATCLAANGDRDEADRQLKHLAADYPGEFWVLYHYADMAARRGDFAAAVARWEAGLRTFPGRPDVHAQLVQALLRAGDLVGAVTRLDSAAFMFPRDISLLAARDAVIAAGGKPAPLP